MESRACAVKACLSRHLDTGIPQEKGLIGISAVLRLKSSSGRKQTSDLAGVTEVVAGQQSRHWSGRAGDPVPGAARTQH